MRITGQIRAWSGFWPEWDYRIELRRDLAKWSYGATWNHRSTFAFYRTDELDVLINEKPFVSIFAEYRPDKRTTLRLDADNVLDGAGQRMRTFFAPNRSSPTPFITEFRHRDAHASVTFSINRTFGGSGS